MHCVRWCKGDGLWAAPETSATRRRSCVASTTTLICAHTLDPVSICHRCAFVQVARSNCGAAHAGVAVQAPQVRRRGDEAVQGFCDEVLEAVHEMLVLRSSGGRGAHADGSVQRLGKSFDS